MQKEESGVLLLERNGFYFSDGKKIAKFDFKPDVVRDLDILNQEVLLKSIFDFIDKEKFDFGKFLFILSESAIFVVGSEEKNISLVPYNNVVSKKYQSKEGDIIIASNKDLIDLISEAFVGKGYGRDEIVPAMLFGQIAIKPGLDLETANYIIKNQDLATDKSMDGEIPVLQQPVSEVFKVTKGKSTMLPMLLGVMGVMVLVLVLLLVFRK